jgi:hypothetical protein
MDRRVRFLTGGSIVELVVGRYENRARLARLF